MYTAVGCADTAAPPNTTVVRDGDRLTVRCNHSEQVWYLVCINSSWHGETINCNNGPPPSTSVIYARLYVFWATVCKTVRPTLSVRCPSCLSVLSVTFVHCGQTVGRIKMKLGTQVGLGSGRIVLGGDQAPPSPEGHNFRPIAVVAKWLHGSRCHLVWS